MGIIIAGLMYLGIIFAPDGNGQIISDSRDTEIMTDGIDD